MKEQKKHNKNVDGKHAYLIQFSVNISNLCGSEYPLIPPSGIVDGVRYCAITAVRKEMDLW